MVISLHSLPNICCISALNPEAHQPINPFIGLLSSGCPFSFQKFQSSTVRGRHELKFFHRFNLFADFSRKYAAKPSTRTHDVFVAKGIIQKNTKGELSKNGSHTREHGDDPRHSLTVFSFIEADESNKEVPSFNKTTNEVAHEIMEMAEQNKSTDINIHGEGDDTFSSHIKSSGPFWPMKNERQVLEEIAEENSLAGNKFFVYPQNVKADANIEVFLNRSISNMKKTPVVLVKGAFNGWRWKAFTATMRKTELDGDWWSCLIHVPIEAYKIDFVFFNGANIYDNNETKDFCIHVEGGMDFLDFEDFLLEEKHKELQRIAEDEACKKRLAAEGRQHELLNASIEEDRIKSKAEINRRQNYIHQLMKRYSFSIDSSICQIEPFEFKQSHSVSLYYRKDLGPLASADNIWIHAGCNNWEDGASIVQKIEPSERKDGDWWHTSVAAPEGVSTLDWVFANGPLGKATVFDNNSSQDFRIILENYGDELYWSQEENKLYYKLQDERRQKEKSLRAKGERSAQMKAETKKKTLKSFLLSQNNVVHTDPFNVLGGKNVIVYYNPSGTVLDGKSEVWFRYSFNNWSHRRSPFHPQRMVPVENGDSHFKATVNVPLDAYIMDFVFSEREDGGIFDNKDGRDYHIPISGGVVKKEPLHIIHIAVEMAPIAKVGGLGDVVTSLSRALKDLNYEVNIILPKYDCINSSNVSDIRFYKNYSWDGNDIKVWHGIVEGLSVYFIDHDKGSFHMGCIYGSQNDAERFGFFSQSAVEFLIQSDLRPDIIHCHDWSSAPVAWLLKERYSHTNSLGNARVVFTIHNLEFGSHFIEKAIVSSDKATTVSPTYAKEVSGNPIIRPHLSKFQGILNGIDPDIWDPYNDHFIPVPYTSENVADGKRAAKDALQQKLGLRRSDIPLLGIVTRLTHQKGIHLIKHAILLTLARGAQVVLLGSAPDPRIENEFSNLADQLHSSHHDRARLRLTYDEPLSHLIYAGSDFIFVPSIFEPCGLTQLIAMRYGSVPVVRKTGGLHDTVFDVDHDRERALGEGLEPNGFSFDGVESAGVDYALNRAITAWYESLEWLNSLRKLVMEQDWSWNRPSLQYSHLYRETIC